MTGTDGASFQSTLPRRERRVLTVNDVQHVRDFNPRSREGSDQVGYNVMRCRDISIHAPAKGATPWGLLYFQPRNHFNPRSREGSDGPTAKREVFRIYFNPRSREGSDLQVR